MKANHVKIIEMIIVVGIAYTMVANPLAWRTWGDSSKYIDMVNGLPSVEPWSSRPLIPLLARVIMYILPVDVAHAFYYMNITFFALAGLLLHREHDLTATLVTMACLSPAIFIFGTILLDSAIFFCVAMALFLRERPYILTVFCTITAAVHPMAFALCGVILLFSVQKNKRLYLVIMPVLTYLIWFLPIGSYTTFIIPDFIDLIYILKIINALWLGLLFLKRDRESALIVMLLLVSAGFTVFLTMPSRAFTPIALLLGPKLVKGITNSIN